MASSESEAGQSNWYVYVLRCADGSLYTGVATDVMRRLRQHNGEIVGGPKYTRGRRPVTVAWTCCESSQSAALKREAAIKRLTREEKQQLISRQ